MYTQHYYQCHSVGQREDEGEAIWSLGVDRRVAIHVREGEERALFQLVLRPCNASTQGVAHEWDGSCQ